VVASGLPKTLGTGTINNQFSTLILRHPTPTPGSR
jgi:hypothetical protein